MPQPHRHGRARRRSRDAEPSNETLDIDRRIDDALAASFPASDPPPWTLGAPRWSTPTPAPGPAPAPRPRGRHPMRRVEDLMGSDVHWVPSDMPLEQAALELASHQQTGVPVCTRDGKVVGVLSLIDVAKLYGGATERRLVRDIMTSEVLAVRPDDSVERALHTMANECVHDLLVIDRDDHLLGVVTSMDVLREVAGLRRQRPRRHAPVDR